MCVCVCVCVCAPARVYLPNPFARAGYDTKLVSKRSLPGLNSRFSFSQIGCDAKVIETSLSYYSSY